MFVPPIDQAFPGAARFTELTWVGIFLPIVLAVYFLAVFGVAGNRGRRTASLRGANWVLLASSVAFYTWGDMTLAAVIVGAAGFNYVVARAIDRRERRGAPQESHRRSARALVAFAITVDLLVLVAFKYAGFVVASVNSIVTAFGVRPFSVPRVPLPMGLPLFTLFAISYVVDVYRREAGAHRHPVHAALYLLFFPQVVAGPIVRFRETAEQLSRRSVGVAAFAYGVRRFVIGLGKKLLIADTLAGPADAIFALPAGQLGAGPAWFAILCFTLQIYFDFSGYCDMAIGLARMFGFRPPENFRWPYVAQSLDELWRRWHISLAAWFRDYVYVPLGGSHLPRRRASLNVVTLFALWGLWHGAGWGFLVWGLYHGLFLRLEHRHLAGMLKRSSRPARHVYVLLVAAIGWVFFRAETLSGGIAFLKAMAGMNGAAPVTIAPYVTFAVCAALVAGALGSAPLVPSLGRWGVALDATTAALLMLMSVPWVWVWRTMGIVVGWVLPSRRGSARQSFVSPVRRAEVDRPVK